MIKTKRVTVVFCAGLSVCIGLMGLRMGRVAEAAEEVDRARVLEPTNPLIPGFVASVKLHRSQKG